MASRQLAAIMFTDIVGYTALMERDEQRAFQLLDENREIQRPLIEKFKWQVAERNGRWNFGQLYHGFRCSLLCWCHSESLRRYARIFCRIGIHQGEVVFKDGDVFGSGVNIASRLESISPVGGILVSESVYQNIKNKEGISAKFLREENLKNLDGPIKIYQANVETDESLKIPPVRLERWSRLASRKLVIVSAVTIILLLIGYAGYQYISNEAPVNDHAVAEAEIDKSIAVLPFVDMSPDRDQEYLGDGVAEEIINVLAQIQGLKVIGRTSSFSYKGRNVNLQTIGQELDVGTILEGSVRKDENTIRITAQFINTSDGSHI